MRTVKDACVLQEGALDVHVSDQVEQLDGLINAEGNGTAFFAKTHITQGMRTLITEGIARLAGQSNQAIFHLRQAMGGGKTHLLVGFGLLARNPSLRQDVCPGVSHIDKFGPAKTAAFSGRNNPVEYFWGEIAKQLGKPDVFKDFWVNGPVAPDERDWLRLFDGDEPILILMDEMPPYFQNYITKEIGRGTVADIVTRAFANMLSAAGKKKNVCVVISDLSASYATGSKLINSALEDARQELGRQERNITPVDLESDEIYEILRKRLFKELPDRLTIEDIAAEYGRVLEDASKAKVISRGAESIADEIVNTYPFHPRLKNLVALFKENEKFKQTRGLLELVSRLLRSVWERRDNDVYLIGPHHFDLKIPDVRDKLSEVSAMQDVIARDLWDSNSAAHAQIIDINARNDCAAQVGALLLCASLSTAVNAVRGLTREEIVECLATPNRAPSDFLAAFDELDKAAWYLHHTSDGRYYFDRQENLTKMLQNYVDTAPPGSIDDLIKHRLSEMFKPVRKTAYSEAVPLPKLDEVADKVRRDRVLLIVSPDSKLPPAEVQKFFLSLTQKNNVCVLTGDRTELGSLTDAAKHVWAGEKASKKINENHPQHEELQRKREAYEQDFMATFLGLFDKVFFPRQSGKTDLLEMKPLSVDRIDAESFNGEDQIEKTLSSNPIKLYLDVDTNFDAIRTKAEMLLWPAGQDEARWTDIVDRMAEQAGMPWLPPKGLEQVKTIAINRGLWEDLGNGYISKKPKKKRTSVQVVEETTPDDEGNARLRVIPQNAGPAPRIHFAEDAPVTQQSPVLQNQTFTTKALRVNFLVIDPSNTYETGDPVTWVNKLVIRSNLIEDQSGRKVELFVAPKGEIRYTLDGTEPRDGLVYKTPVSIGDGEVKILVFAEAEGLEAHKEFTFPAKGQKGPKIDDQKPARLSGTGQKSLDSRSKTYSGLGEAKAKAITFDRVTINVGQGSKMAQVMIMDEGLPADYLEAVLAAVLSKFDASAPVSMVFRGADFKTGYDLKEFAKKFGIEVKDDEVKQ